MKYSNEHVNRLNPSDICKRDDRVVIHYSGLSYDLWGLGIIPLTHMDNVTIINVLGWFSARYNTSYEFLRGSISELASNELLISYTYQNIADEIVCVEIVVPLQSRNDTDEIWDIKPESPIVYNMLYGSNSVVNNNEDKLTLGLRTVELLIDNMLTSIEPTQISVYYTTQGVL